MLDIKPDTHLESVAVRHKATDQKRLAKLKESMERNGWHGRPLLVLTNQTGVYEAITGVHRAKVATQLHIPIPAVTIPEGALTAEQRQRVLSGEQPYETLPQFFQEVGLSAAAELMREELKSSWAEPIAPTVKPSAGSKRSPIRRVDPDDLKKSG